MRGNGRCGRGRAHIRCGRNARIQETACRGRLPRLPPRERVCEAFRLPKPPEVRRDAECSGLRRELAQAAVGFIGDARVRIILLDLFVKRERFFWIGLPKDAGELQQHQGLRNQD